MSSTRSDFCFALVDCNNFFVSCEQIFNPALTNKPVIVLSSNDGCVVARSNEAKNLNIKMGQPYFEIKNICEKNKVFIFSSNFALYGDISNRVMKTLQHFSLDVEVYSIDEAFLRLDKIAFADPLQYAIQIRKAILKNIGIPVSIGIAPTKTLAKLAGNIAKKDNITGVCDLRDQTVREIILQHHPVDNIWGVGKKSTQYCHDINIRTAKQLCDKPESYLRKHFGLGMVKTVMELKGISCLALSETENSKTIIRSRSFGKSVTSIIELSEALSFHCAHACEKARAQKLKAQGVCVYFRTSLYDPRKPAYTAQYSQVFLQPSNDTCHITSIAKSILKKLYQPGYEYKKAGIVLLNLISDEFNQCDLFEENISSDNKNLMSLLDQANQRFGAQTLFLAAEGTEKNWVVRSARRSPRYTTCWDELREVF